MVNRLRLCNLHCGRLRFRAADKETAVAKKNVLWIMTDQYNARCLSAFGSQARTPNLDRLVAEGVAFDSAYANNPVCTPSRISFITGQYPHTHQMLSNGFFEWNNRNPNTLACLLRGRGWQTGLVGKAHMCGQWDADGFEHIRYCDNADGWRNDPRNNHYYRYLVEHGIADRYDYGAIKSGPGSDLRGFESAIPYEHALETWTGNEALSFLENRDRERPFFLHYSFERPHEPLSVPHDRGLLYNPDEIELPANARDLFENAYAGKHPILREWGKQRKGYPYRPLDEADLRHQVAYYYSIITLIDEQIGRVIDRLKETGDYENTVIFFTADHGDFAGEHGLHLKNIGIYEAIHRIPFVLRYPGCPRGKRVGGIVESVDLYPTICELLGVVPPAGIEGKSMLPVIADDRNGKSAAYCEWDCGRYEGKVNAIRTARYRMIVYDEKNGGELFDMQKDPGELENLYDDPGHKDVKVELLEKLLRFVGRYRTDPRGEEQLRLDRSNTNNMAQMIFKKDFKWSEIKRYVGSESE